MEGFGKEKVVACACFMAAFTVAFVVIGTFDNSLDAVLAVDDIARHDAEWALSSSFGAFAIVGLFSLWVFSIGSWIGGSVAGLLAACAAGGFHTMSYVLEWMPVALAVGFASGFVVFAINRKGSVACALFSVEVALAVFQIVFIIQNM